MEIDVDLDASCALCGPLRPTTWPNEMFWCYCPTEDFPLFHWTFDWEEFCLFISLGDRCRHAIVSLVTAHAIPVVCR